MKIRFTLFTALAFTVSAAFAYDPIETRLHARKTVVPSAQWFGTSVVSNERWIAAGEPFNDDQASNNGAVHVFNAVTGAYVRRLLPSDTNADRLFGVSVSISGNLALVGASNSPGPGTAYVFNLITGKEITRLTPNDSHNGDFFGTRVALEGTTAVVTATGGDGLVVNSGSAYVFDAITGQQLTEIYASDGSVGDNFGERLALRGGIALVGVRIKGKAYCFDTSASGPVTTEFSRLEPSDGEPVADSFGAGVALSNGLAFVGSPLHDLPITDCGAVYVFDVTTGTMVVNEIAKLAAPDAAAGTNFARNLYVEDHLLAVSSSTDSSKGFEAGAVYLFDVSSGGFIKKVFASDGRAEDSFGSSVSLSNGTLVVGAFRSSTYGPQAGGVYTFRRVAAPLPLQKIAAIKDSAPATYGNTFTKFSDAVINSDGEVHFLASLGGAAGATNSGFWSTLAGNDSLKLSVRKGYDLGFGKIAGLFRPVSNQPNFTLLEVVLSGAGISANNNRALVGDNGGFTTKLLRLGDSPFGAGKLVSAFLQAVQSRDAVQGQAVTFKLKGAVTPTSDSGLATLLNNGVIGDSILEGEPSPAPGNPNFGQFSRVAFANSEVAFTAALAAAPAVNQGVFSFVPGGAKTLVAQKGDAAPGGGTFAAFLGEAKSLGEDTVFKATLTGAGSQNVGLWSNHTGVLALVARKGDPVPGLTNVVWDKILQFWGMNPAFAQKQVLFLAKMKGSSVNAANDLGLWLLQEDGSYLLLLREGDVVPSRTAGRIGVIQRVAVEGLEGKYAVQVSIAQGAANQNQAILMGDTNTGSATTAKVTRRANIKLRKGALYNNGFSGQTSIRSLALSPAVDPSGAGGKGLGNVLNEFNELFLTVQFDNRVVQMMRGTP